MEPGEGDLAGSRGAAGGEVLGAQGLHGLDQTLLEPYEYLCNVPGKDVRGRLIDAFQAWLRIPEDKVPVIKDIISSLHTASLLIDDIEDNSKLRRGVPVAHSIYGVPSTINTANYVYFLALEKCHALRSPEAVHVFISELLNLHRGQGQDILWRDKMQCPTEEQYKTMVLDKTGGLFRLAVRLMQCFSDNRDDFIDLVNQLALYFQLRDDYINLASDEYMLTKSFCEDLTEGKFSFPIIHSLQATPGDSRLLNILRQRTDDVELKRYAVRWMHSTGSLEYTRTALRGIKADVVREIARLGGHGQLEALIETLDAQLDGPASGTPDGPAAEAAPATSSPVPRSPAAAEDPVPRPARPQKSVDTL